MEERAVGVDWGGTRFRAAVVAFRGVHFAIRHRVEESWPSATDPVEDLARAASVLRKLDPEGLPTGLALAAILRRDGRVVKTPNLAWRIPGPGLSLEGAADWRRPLHVVNDVNAAAWAEYSFGAGRGSRAMLAFFLGTGLGAGFVCEGRLWEGASGMALELGHVRVRPGGRKCGCGGRGCVEAYVGGRALQQRIREECPPGSILFERAGEPGAVHAGHLGEAARRADPWAVAVLDEASELLAWALADAITLLDPDRIVGGGSVWLGLERLREGVARRLPEFVSLAGHRPRIRTAELGPDAGLVGAASLALSRSVR